MCNVAAKTALINPEAPSIIWLVLGLVVIYIFCTVLEKMYKKHQNASNNTCRNSFEEEF